MRPRSKRKALTVAEYAVKYKLCGPTPIKTLADVAAARMRQLFGSRVVAEFDRKLALAAVVASGGRCVERGCPWRALAGKTRCRGHLHDLIAEQSIAPSTLSAVAPPSHAHA